MPTLSASHIVLDLPTLLAVTFFVTVIGGLLLLFAFLQNRTTPALALWGIGYLVGAAGAALLGAPGSMPNAWSVCVANTLLCGAYALMWSGARSFEGRRVPAALVAAGPAIWMVAFQFQVFAESVSARVSLLSAITATYALAAAAELWHARDRDLISRWPTLILVVGHAGFLLARIPFAPVLASSFASGQAQSAVVTVIAFEALFAAFCLPFLRVAMSKERAELEQRKAALTDSLTGVANRRAFFDRGGPLLERAIAARQPAALLLFDLDGFKIVNDTAGHPAGNRVLQAFCHLVAETINPGDLFGRLGGDEFACLLAGASMTQALTIAERLRRDYAAMRWPDLALDPTVSIGVAMASEAGRDLLALLANADRALYRAKADGRNRVAPAPLVLVEATGGDIVRRTADCPPPAVPAPVAG
jgi:diguanylate cyclase (GGDEF)-like protein